MYVREEVGGSGLTRADGVLVFETLASGCPSIAGYLSIHNMVAWMIDQYGEPAQRERWLPRLCAMEDLASYCLTEPGAGSDAAALRTRAVRDGGHYVLTGVKQFISGAGASQVYVVLARTGADGPHGISAFLVDKDDPGLSFGPNERKMGWNAQPTRQVILDGVRLSADRLLGHEGEGFRIAMNGLNGGRLGIAACSSAAPATPSTAAWPTSPNGRRSAGAFSTRRRSSSGWRTWRPSWPPPARWSTRPPRHWTAAIHRRRTCARWPSGSPPTPDTPSPTGLCNCTAATAT